ncbi:hypothetical protein H4R18_000312 [Coemansia javaensis]|uniref:Thiol methyltransferase 1 n=1 Tax=Coemansia javaensis TaxID=2761396 RepID=A0A9W8HGH1_9FUNG|nr:hypothetical protein H4R18_000312 [Coemansia javaensis]
MAVSAEAVALAPATAPLATDLPPATSLPPTKAPAAGHPADAHMSDAHVAARVQRAWDEYWASGARDADPVAPAEALRELLEDHRWLLPRGRCLVAGCGRGADALYLAGRGLACVAVDISEGALLRAAGPLPGRVTFAAQDLLSFRPAVRFTVAYECGLFSAIHPSQRAQWAAAYARLVAPQGSLIVLLCPLMRCDQSPSHLVTMAECEAHLKRYFVLVRVDSNCRCVEGQEGNELMSVWKRL